MRVVTNDNRISSNKQRAQILFFLSIVGLLGSFFLVNTIQDADFALTVQCGLMPLLLLMVITSVRMTNNWVRQPYPWMVLQESLKGAGSDYTLYNYLMPANHVLIGPNGIFAITTRFQDAPQAIKGDKWKRTSGPLTIMRQEQIGNPTYEARLKATQTQAFLRTLLDDDSIEVQPLVVFTHPKATVEMEGELSIPVLFASSDRKKLSLKTYIKDQKDADHPTITKEQQNDLDDVLLYKD